MEILLRESESMLAADSLGLMAPKPEMSTFTGLMEAHSRPTTRYLLQMA
jgi:hypothetical protein